MLQSAVALLPVGSATMSDNREWLLPSEVERLLGFKTKLTRPRRSRIFAQLEQEGVQLDRQPNLTLVNRQALLAFLDDVRTGKRPTPRWLSDTEQLHE